MNLYAALASVGGLSGLSALAAVIIRGRAQNRRDAADARKAGAEADAVFVGTARELVSEVRAEMDRKVTDLAREVGRLRGHLEAAIRERDHLREVETALRNENHQLRARVELLEQRVRVLTAAAELAEASGRVVADRFDTGAAPPGINAGH